MHIDIKTNLRDSQNFPVNPFLQLQLSLLHVPPLKHNTLHWSPR